MPKEFIYSVYKDGEYIGDFRGKDIRIHLSMSSVSFSAAVAEGRIIRGHYRIIPVDEVIPKRSPLLKEFNQTAKDILKKAGRPKGENNGKDGSDYNGNDGIHL